LASKEEAESRELFSTYSFFEIPQNIEDFVEISEKDLSSIEELMIV
jgi:hypothetical protein